MTVPRGNPTVEDDVTQARRHMSRPSEYQPAPSASQQRRGKGCKHKGEVVWDDSPDFDDRSAEPHRVSLATPRSAKLRSVTRGHLPGTIEPHSQTAYTAEAAIVH